MSPASGMFCPSSDSVAVVICGGADNFQLVVTVSSVRRLCVRLRYLLLYVYVMFCLILFDTVFSGLCSRLLCW